MIDLITLTKRGLTDAEIGQIVKFNKLQTNSKASVIYYDNMNTKNIHDKFYIRIEPDRNLKLSVSVHKYKNFIDRKEYVNYDLFSMSDVSTTIKAIASQTGLNINELSVYGYEIGLNLYLSKDCRFYLDKIQAIGIFKAKQDFHVNPKYKNRRTKTTYLYREKRKVYKVYDKNFEMNEKKRTEPTVHPNILRIETTFRRVEKMTLIKFLSPENIQRMTDQFIRDWRTVAFDRDIKAPTGTHKRKIDLCKQILLQGKEQVLNKATDDFKKGIHTDRIFRDIREFIQHDWDTFKTSLIVVQSDEEQEYKKVLKETFCLVCE